MPAPKPDVKLIHGDCLFEMGLNIEPESVDAIVCDPPYGISFKDSSWDHGVPGKIFWQQALKCLKPGGHLIAFSSARTYHRLATAIEDAGFEIRDQILWLYGSGMPKGNDISKAIDKANAEVDAAPRFTAFMRTTGLSIKQLNTATGTTMGSHYLTAASQPAVPTPELWAKIKGLITIPIPEEIEQIVIRVSAKRAVVATVEMKDFIFHPGRDLEHTKVAVDITQAATDQAKKWEGWNTALKPAHEPAVLARKPFFLSNANNVLKHGVGALNVGACQVEGNRWPANLIHDGSADVQSVFPASSGQNASRFFYCPKASPKDRNEGLVEMRNNHATVKPTELMGYLCRLVTPPGGVVMDPFAGSFSTGKAALREGFSFVGIEKDADYFKIGKARVEHELKLLNSKGSK